jgi:pyruvate ferredoxin oxidoreductase gamma subunit
MLELRIHGRGGQGVVTMAEILAKAAMKTGKEVQTVPFFGVERRGAAVKVAVRFDDHPIKLRSLSQRPDILVLMDEAMLPIALSEGTNDSYFVVYNGTHPLDIKRIQWQVNATEIAYENNLVVGSVPFINVPMAGALCRVLDIPFEALESVLKEEWGKKADMNIKGARAAYERVQKVEV